MQKLTYDGYRWDRRRSPRPVRRSIQAFMRTASRAFAALLRNEGNPEHPCMRLEEFFLHWGLKFIKWSIDACNIM